MHLTYPLKLLFAIHQALLAGREKAPPIFGLHDFMLEMLAVLFPALVSMVWPSLNFTLVLSMAFTGESSCCTAVYGAAKWGFG